MKKISVLDHVVFSIPGRDACLASTGTFADGRACTFRQLTGAGTILLVRHTSQERAMPKWPPVGLAYLLARAMARDSGNCGAKCASWACTSGLALRLLGVWWDWAGHSMM